MTSISNEKVIWEQTAEMHGNFSVPLSSQISLQFRDNPSELIHLLSRYKFSAKMACKKGEILEIGCGSGFGAPILAEFAHSYLGIDTDLDEIESAKINLNPPKFNFLQSAFTKQFNLFDAIISINKTPHTQELFASFLATILDNLKENGIVVIGFQNKPNLLVRNLLECKFNHTFLFSMNNETLLSGHNEHSDYCFCISFYRK